MATYFKRGIEQFVDSENKRYALLIAHPFFSNEMGKSEKASCASGGDRGLLGWLNRIPSSSRLNVGLMISGSKFIQGAHGAMIGHVIPFLVNRVLVGLILAIATLLAVIFGFSVPFFNFRTDHPNACHILAMIPIAIQIVLIVCVEIVHCVLFLLNRLIDIVVHALHFIFSGLFDMFGKKASGGPLLSPGPLTFLVFPLYFLFAISSRLVETLFVMFAEIVGAVIEFFGGLYERPHWYLIPDIFTKIMPPRDPNVLRREETLDETKNLKVYRGALEVFSEKLGKEKGHLTVGFRYSIGLTRFFALLVLGLHIVVEECIAEGVFRRLVVWSCHERNNVPKEKPITQASEEEMRDVENRNREERLSSQIKKLKKRGPSGVYTVVPSKRQTGGVMSRKEEKEMKRSVEPYKHPFQSVGDADRNGNNTLDNNNDADFHQHYEDGIMYGGASGRTVTEPSAPLLESGDDAPKDVVYC